MYFFSIRHDNVINVIGRTPLGQIIVNAVPVEDIEEAAFRLSEYSGEVLNGIPFGGCIDDAEHLLEVILDELLVHQHWMYPCS